MEVNGVLHKACQANNMYIFPGLALGAFLAQGNRISDKMIIAAAKAIPDLITQEELNEGRVYPDLSNIRNISRHVAENVVKAAHEDGDVVNHGLLLALSRGESELKRYIKSSMFWPAYKSLVSP